MIAGMMAAGAGMLHILLNKKVGPEILSVTYTVDPLLMTIIGGIGTLTGPIIGATGLHLTDTVLREAIFQIGPLSIHIADVWGMVLGLIFILVVLIFPQGMVGTWIRRRVQTRHTPTA
jgi:branched-chain amino acid transport system permease protein